MDTGTRTRCHEDDEKHYGEFNPDIVKDGDGIFLKILSGSEATLYKILPFINPLRKADGNVEDREGSWNLGRNPEKGTYSAGVPGNGVEGGIVCVSCHAVHGVQDDSDANNPVDIPRKLLLPIK